MKRSLIVIFVILGIAFFTNPKPHQHTELLINKLKPEMVSALTEGKDIDNLSGIEAVGLMFGSQIAESFLGNLITVDNYLFFSITNFTWDNETNAIAIGLFGNLFLFKDFEKFRIYI